MTQKRSMSPRIISLILFILVATTLLVALSVHKLNEKYNAASETYIQDVKKRYLYDIVNLIHQSSTTAYENSYRIFENRIENDVKLFTGLFKERGNHRTCEVISLYTQSHPQLHITASRNGVAFCQPIEQPYSDGRSDTGKDVSRRVTLKSGELIRISYPEQAILIFLENKITHLITNISLTEKDAYIWVNEILDYDGGEGYAIRRIHQSLPETVGMKLSTGMTDSEGRQPYLEELQGIKKNSELFFEYYFKRPASDEMAKKTSYAKLFKPLNWVIASGVYNEDINTYIATQQASLASEINLYYIFLGASLFFWVLLSMLLIYFILKERHLRKLQSVELKHYSSDVESYKQVLYTLLDIVEKRDTYTAGHTKRVAEYAMMIARNLDLTKDDISILYDAAIMHDIGKVEMPDSVLLKPGRLNHKEFAIIKKHLDSSYSILNSINFFKPHANIVRYHHEKYDGSGYPQGVSGVDIPFLSHILIIADAFDAMTSDRVYKKKKTLTAALEELINLKGKQFSPALVDIAVAVFKEHGLLPIESNDAVTEIEMAKYDYFYRDSLTGLYNYNFFENIIKRDIKCCYFIDIKNFSMFNREYGWLEGDKILVEISEHLEHSFPDAILFRVFGDDFLICSREHVELDAEMLKSMLEIDTSLFDIKLYHCDLIEQSIVNFEGLTKNIDNFVKGHL